MNIDPADKHQMYAQTVWLVSGSKNTHHEGATDRILVGVGGWGEGGGVPHHIVHVHVLQGTIDRVDALKFETPNIRLFL